MDARQRSLQELQQIKKMMEHSSKFISLSGLSGIAAGICALAGAWLASVRIDCWLIGDCNYSGSRYEATINMQNELLVIAIATFTLAFLTSFMFTYVRSKKTGLPLWGTTAYRLFWNIGIPLAAGAVFVIRTMQLEYYELIAPGCLIFYGLALVNASKYTLGELRYLGYAQLVLGILNLWLTAYGLYFWAAGFGLLHIIYGTWMWFKYERVRRTNETYE